MTDEYLVNVASKLEASGTDTDPCWTAVLHVIRRIQEDPNLAYYCCELTRTFEVLCMAAAAHEGMPVLEVMKAVRTNLQNTLSQLEPDVCRMRSRVEALEKKLEAAGVEE
jgi:hypothetical protein